MNLKRQIIEIHSSENSQIVQNQSEKYSKISKHEEIEQHILKQLMYQNKSKQKFKISGAVLKLQYSI